MHPRFRKVAVFAGAAVLATAVGVGVASQGDETSSSQAAAAQRAGAPGAPPGAPGGNLSALAQELGVSEAELAAAMESVRSSLDPGSAPHRGDADPMAAALAQELGLSTDEVSAALESLRPDGAAPPDGSTGDGATTGATQS